MRWIWLMALVLVGCSKDENPSIATLEGARYEWELFNHRLSHFEVRLDKGDVEMAVVGGTSTTGVPADLPAACEAEEEGCRELPFDDWAIVRVDWARVDAPEALAEVATATLTADEDGETASVTVTLDGAEDVPVSAWIQGFRLSTDHPLDDGTECYDPSFGWLPTHFSLGVTNPTVKGDKVTVDVEAAFAAGNTMEDIRQCIDAVIDRARVAIEVDVLIIAGGSESVSKAVSSEATWERSTVDVPVPQNPPAAEALKLGLEDPLVGWQALSWDFHIGDPEGRGAYLRSLGFQADEREATGSATNESATALSGFDYRFDGVVVGKDLGGTVTRGSLETTLDVDLEPSGEPVLHAVGQY